MLSVHLAPIFEARGIHNPLRKLKNAVIPKDSAAALIAGRKVNISCRQIEILCQLLVCEPSDLFVFTADKSNPIPADHPLLNLQQIENQETVQDALAANSYKELKKLIASSKKG